MNIGKTVPTSEQSDPCTASDDHPDLILPSEKRRGVYECDYCHSDISQHPRIRCAVCVEFDLCLDCFSTVDHGAAIARLKAMADVQSALGESYYSAALHHDDTHGYRVCDSIRYPIFPSIGNIQRNRNEEGSAEEGESKQDERTEKEQRDIRENDTNGSSNEDVEMQGNAKGNEFIADDPKNYWTVEEDLRLIEGIKKQGLGNWVEISEIVSGQGSVGKTPRRCMERYFDNYLGRYGEILPPFILIATEDDEEEENVDTTVHNDYGDNDDDDDGSNKVMETPRSSKRRAAMLRSPSAISNNSLASRKKYKIVPTNSIPGYENVWPKPYLPPRDGIELGQEVGREEAIKAELMFVKTIANLQSKEEVDRVTHQWRENRLNKPGGPTVLPPRPDDVIKLPGSELAGFMPRRGDFDVEWENEAEVTVADMEFLPGESEQDKQLKLKVLAIYNTKLDEREKRREFILKRGLYDYKLRHQEDHKLPRDERDLVHRMRLFERFHTPEEHKQFIDDLLKAKRLRKEIAKLQMYRRMGIRTLEEAERYELDKERRYFHKTAQAQAKAQEAKADASAGAPVGGEAIVKAASSHNDESISSSLWKQYRTSRVRRSLNREASNDLLVANTSDANAIEKETDVAQETAAHDEDVGTSTAIPLGEASVEENKESPEHPLSQYPGYSLLSTREKSLCHKVGIKPQAYLDIKKALIHESLKSGLLDNEGPGSSRKSIVKIDVERRGDIVDFMVGAGWISNKLGTIAKELPKDESVN